MKDQSRRLPVPREALPDFDPVPRKPRHDGWTPERQRAFVGALADTGCVRIAARMVNMTPESAYMLRRAPGAEPFRKAWEAAQNLGLQVVKDEAFDRAMNGQLVPVFVGGKLMGFRRKKNDRLLMFILRHYGQDAGGRKTTINYFSTRATAGAAAPRGRRELRSSAPGSARDAGSGRPTTGEAVSIDVTDSLRDGGSAQAAAETSTTTIQTVTSAPPAPGADPHQAAALLEAFEGTDLDAEAQAEIYRTLEACAERRRALASDPAADPDCPYVSAAEAGDFAGELVAGADHAPPAYRSEDNDGPEHYWHSLGEGGEAAQIDAVLAEMAAAKAEARRAQEEAPADPPRPALPAPAVELQALSPSLAPQRPADGSLIERPISPRTSKPLRAYKKRTPKPAFTADG